MIRRPPRSTQSRSSAASDVYKRQILTRFIDREHRFTLDTRQFILHSRENEFVAKIAKAIVAQDKDSGHLAPGCCPTMRKHAEHVIKDTPYAPYAAWLDDQSVQPLRAGLLNESRRSADKSTPDIECCLLYTSDAADDLLCVDLGGRRIIKKK